MVEFHRNDISKKKILRTQRSSCRRMSAREHIQHSRILFYLQQQSLAKWK